MIVDGILWALLYYFVILHFLNFSSERRVFVLFFFVLYLVGLSPCSFVSRLQFGTANYSFLHVGLVAAPLGFRWRCLLGPGGLGLASSRSRIPPSLSGVGLPTSTG